MNTTLNELVETYFNLKEQLSELDSETKSYNTQIKSLMKNQDIATVTTPNNIIATFKTINVTSLNEDALLEDLQKIWNEHHRGEICPFIKTKFYIDMDELENAIYNGIVDKSVIGKHTVVKPQTRLTIKRG